MKRRSPLPFPQAPAALLATLGLAATVAVLTPARGGGTEAVPLAMPDDGRLALHAVFQLEDCAATAAAFDILDHPTLAGRVRLETLVFVGEPGQARQAMRRMGHRARGKRLVVAGPAARRAFRAMGFRRTPFFYVADAGGAIRLASQVPTGPLQLRALHAKLQILVDQVALEPKEADRAT